MNVMECCIFHQRIDLVEFFISSAWYLLYETPMSRTWDRLFVAPPSEAQGRSWHGNIRIRARFLSQTVEPTKTIKLVIFSYNISWSGGQRKFLSNTHRLIPEYNLQQTPQNSKYLDLYTTYSQVLNVFWAVTPIIYSDYSNTICESRLTYLTWWEWWTWAWLTWHQTTEHFEVTQNH